MPAVGSVLVSFPDKTFSLFAQPIYTLFLHNCSSFAFFPTWTLCSELTALLKPIVLDSANSLPSHSPSSLLFPQFQERNASACLTFCSHTLAITPFLLPPTYHVSLIEDGRRKEHRRATNYLLSFKKVKSGFVLVWRSSILVPKNVCYMITQTIRGLLRRIANSFLFTELVSYSKELVSILLSCISFMHNQLVFTALQTKTEDQYQLFSHSANST